MKRHTCRKHLDRIGHLLPGSSLLLFVAIAAGCGGGGGSAQPFVNCGNGVVESGEQCDDGGRCQSGFDAGEPCTDETNCRANPPFSSCDNETCTGGTKQGEPCTEDSQCPNALAFAQCLPNDNDDCLSTCRIAVCGDDLVNERREDCDGSNLNGEGCATLGFATGTLLCDADCRFDSSGCGAAFTATATAVPTATPTLGGGVETFTPTPTPTLTPFTDCGNGTVDPGETCDDGNTMNGDACPSNCRIEPCTPSGSRRMADVAFETPEGAIVSSITVRVYYPDGTVGIPGAGSETTVGQRVTNRPSNSIVSVFDADYFLRVVVTRQGTIRPGRLVTVSFNECEGTVPPTENDFICEVEGCASSFGSVEGCTCSVALPAA